MTADGLKNVVDGISTGPYGPRPVAARRISRAAPKSMEGPLVSTARWTLSSGKLGDTSMNPIM